MKKTKIYLGLAALATIGVALIAADHIDAPSTAGQTADITDYFALRTQRGF